MVSGFLFHFLDKFEKIQNLSAVSTQKKNAKVSPSLKKVHALKNQVVSVLILLPDLSVMLFRGCCQVLKTWPCHRVSSSSFCAWNDFPKVFFPFWHRAKAVSLVCFEAFLGGFCLSRTYDPNMTSRFIYGVKATIRNYSLANLFSHDKSAEIFLFFCCTVLQKFLFETCWGFLWNSCHLDQFVWRKTWSTMDNSACGKMSVSCQCTTWFSSHIGEKLQMLRWLCFKRSKRTFPLLTRRASIGSTLDYVAFSLLAILFEIFAGIQKN